MISIGKRRNYQLELYLFIDCIKEFVHYDKLIKMRNIIEALPYYVTL